MFWHQDTIEREKSPDLPEDDPKTHLSEKLKSINIVSSYNDICSENVIIFSNVLN